jgi:hypothetical protein
MPVLRHDDPASFLAAARQVIARDVAEGMLLESRVRALVAKPPAKGTPLYLATCESGASPGAAFQVADHPLSLGASDARAVAPFADDLVRDRPALQGVYGLPAACERFAQRWRDVAGRAARFRFRLRHHVLQTVLPVPVPRGRARVAEPGDIPWLAEAHDAFVADTGIPAWSVRFEEGIALGRYWIWDDDGPVSYAGWSPATPGSARIAPVYTVACRRGGGCATALVSALSAALLRAGHERLALTTDVANPVANAIYARIGFRPTSEALHLDFTDA